MSYLIYRATNTVNGKVYIGLTSKSLGDRKIQHFKQASLKNPKRKTMVFVLALRKYGKDAFHWEILSDGLTKEQASDLEKRLIAELPPKQKYNTAAGGAGVCVPWTDARRQLMSSIMKKRKLPDDVLLAMRERTSRPVVCLTDGRQYTSLSAAAKSYGICRQTIAELCRTRRTTNHGLRFQYLCPTSATTKQTPRSKSVICLNDGQIHETIAAASKCYNLSSSSISNCCRGRVVSTNGMYFSYYQENSYVIDRLPELVSQKHQLRWDANRRPVICVSDGKAYKSVRAAANAYNLSPSVIVGHCNRHSSTQNGLRFTYAEKDYQRKSGGKRRRVLCLDDGLIYQSVTEAARSVGRHPASLVESISLTNRCGGKRFIYIDQESLANKAA